MSVRLLGFLPSPFLILGSQIIGNSIEKIQKRSIKHPSKEIEWANVDEGRTQKVSMVRKEGCKQTSNVILYNIQYQRQHKKNHAVYARVL